MIIDGLVSPLIKDNDNSKTQPSLDNIKGVNKIYYEVNEMILFTSSRYESDIDWRKLTEEKFKD